MTQKETRIVSQNPLFQTNISNFKTYNEQQHLKQEFEQLAD